MSNALANFATTGKFNFKGLVVSILGDLAKLEARVALSKILQSIMGAIIGSSGGNGEMATSFNSDGTFFSPYANGGVFDGSPSLSAYSGQVVSQPTMFAFARGAGVMGEAGPEAILPLKRGSDGKLGVVSRGGGDIIVNTNVTVDSNGNAQSQTGGASQDSARQLGKIIETKVKEVMVSESRQGGQLWRMQHQ
jgi:lambda family phage tail tape measure protein